MSTKCQVCSKAGHGKHFGVNTCRACAAFFRRSVVQSRTYQCRKGNGSCNLSENEKFVCRYCRFQRCTALGMTPENVQWNRDILSTTIERPHTKRNTATESTEQSEAASFSPDRIEVSAQNEKNARLVECTTWREPRTGEALAEARPVIDLSGVMDELRRIFAQESRPSNEQCILVRMFRALEAYRSKKSPRIVFLDTIDLSDKFDSWKSQLYDIATWMMSCEEFAQLPAEDKMHASVKELNSGDLWATLLQIRNENDGPERYPSYEVIFKSSWIPWEKFERLQITLQVFGEEAIEKKMVLTSENKAFNRDTVRLEWGSFTDHDPASIKEMFSRFGSRMTDEVARPLFEMNIDNFELSYILCALIWHVEGKNIQHSTRIQAEAVLDRISDELHDHYTYDLRMPNYAARLTRIMEIISSVEKVQHDRSVVVELARMFDVFKFDVTEKDLFVC